MPFLVPVCLPSSISLINKFHLSLSGYVYLQSLTIILLLLFILKIHLLFNLLIVLDKCLQTVISCCVFDENLCHMRKLTWQGDLRLWRKRLGFWPFNFSLSAWRRQCNILRVADQSFDIFPKFHCRVFCVKAEADLFAVIY